MTTSAETLSALRARLLLVQEPGFWLIGSLVLAIIASNASWFFIRYGRTTFTGEWLRIWPARSAVGWLLQALFVLLLPLAAWKAGAVSPYFMGIAEINWLNSLGTGGPLVALVVAIALIGQTAAKRMWPVRADGPRKWRAPLDAVLWQWHLAFYRAAAVGILSTLSPSLSNAHAAGGEGLRSLIRVVPDMALNAVRAALVADPLYWGIWLGLCVAGVEWLLNPFARTGLRSDGRFEQTLRGLSLAIATTALFALTRNFWLCLVCHVIVEIASIEWRSLWMRGPNERQTP